MENKINPRSKTDNLVTMNLENESLIYDLNNNRAYWLNKTSAMVWEHCDGNTSTLEISNLLSHKLKTLVSEEFIWLALDELKKNNLLENGEDLNNYFPNLSRREIVKKIGLASMVALPIISSVVAPSAVMAVSCGGGHMRQENNLTSRKFLWFVKPPILFVVNQVVIRTLRLFANPATRDTKMIAQPLLYRQISLTFNALAPVFNKIFGRLFFFKLFDLFFHTNLAIDYRD